MTADYYTRWSAVGTDRTSGDVRYSVAIGGRPDMPFKRADFQVGPKPDMGSMITKARMTTCVNRSPRLACIT